MQQKLSRVSTHQTVVLQSQKLTWTSWRSYQIMLCYFWNWSLVFCCFFHPSSIYYCSSHQHHTVLQLVSLLLIFWGFQSPPEWLCSLNLPGANSDNDTSKLQGITLAMRQLGSSIVPLALIFLFLLLFLLLMQLVILWLLWHSEYFRN